MVCLVWLCFPNEHDNGWKEKKGKIVPEYTHRVNRQMLPSTYRETGAVIACARDVLGSGTRIGKKITLHIMDQIQSIDIDSNGIFNGFNLI